MGAEESSQTITPRTGFTFTWATFPVNHHYVLVPSTFRGTFRIDDDTRAVYSESAGIMRVSPAAVALPIDADDLATLCRWSQETGVPLVARGSGSSMAGAAVGSGTVVDLSRLKTYGDVDKAWQRIRVEPGVTRKQVNTLANAQGLRFPVDPSSGAFATIGGMAGTNAAGARTMAFGATRSWVQSIDCVFSDGSSNVVARGAEFVARSELQLGWLRMADGFRARCRELEPRGYRKSSSGYALREFGLSGDLVDLLIGSEGTLAFFTALELKLAPMPGETASILTSWPSLEGALRGAELAREAGAVACELLDATFLRIAELSGTLPVPAGAECVLIMEIESGEDVGRSGAARDVALALADACKRAGASHELVGLEPESEETLWAFRHAASPMLSRLDPHLKSMQIIEDGCVPPDRLADYVRGVRSALDEEKIRGVIFGHAGDAHVHVNALVDVREVHWRDSIRSLFERITSLTIALGGSPSGEHGDGRLRTGVLHRFLSPQEAALHRELKKCFDPDQLLNPGIKTGTPEDPFASIKYDPSLEPLPERAARALKRVEEDRSYDTCRLELLN